MLKIVKIALERNTEISACCCQEALARMRTCLLTRYSAPGVGYGIYLVSNYPMKIKESTWRYDKCMYVFEICAEVIFVTFPWWLQNVKSRSKIAPFSNERHSEIWFPKKRTITFFWSKLSKLHKKDPILHVATIFSPKQGETRSSNGTIPHPLRSWRIHQEQDTYSFQRLRVQICIGFM